MDPNAVGLDDVTGASFVGSLVYSTIEVVHAKKRGGLSSEVKSWLAPVLSFLLVGGIYAGIAYTSGSIYPFAKVVTLAWQAYGHSQGQHNITSSISSGDPGPDPGPIAATAPPPTQDPPPLSPVPALPDPSPVTTPPTPTQGVN